MSEHTFHFIFIHHEWSWPAFDKNVAWPYVLNFQINLSKIEIAKVWITRKIAIILFYTILTGEVVREL